MHTVTTHDRVSYHHFILYFILKQVGLLHMRIKITSLNYSTFKIILTACLGLGCESEKARLHTRGIEWSLRAFASMRALRFILRAQAVIKFALRAAST